MFIAATLLTQVNSVYIYKKYQLTAGTSLPASVLYMIINGIVSAIVPAIVIAATGAKFEFTTYSLIFAAATVICAAVSTILQFKAYEEGQIATVNIMVTIGGIVITCEGDSAIDALVLARAEAKKAKNFAEADRIRDELKAQGIEVTDTKDGASWRRI